LNRSFIVRPAFSSWFNGVVLNKWKIGSTAIMTLPIIRSLNQLLKAGRTIKHPAIGRNAFNTSDILAYSTGRNRLIFTGRSDVFHPWFLMCGSEQMEDWFDGDNDPSNYKVIKPTAKGPGMHNPAIGRNAFNTSDILAYSTGRNRLIFTGRSGYASLVFNVWF
jgi:hypothetical protein